MSSTLVVPPAPSWFARSGSPLEPETPEDSLDPSREASSPDEDEIPAINAAWTGDLATADLARESGVALEPLQQAVPAEADFEFELLDEENVHEDSSAAVDWQGVRLGAIAGVLSAAVHLWLFMTLAGLPHDEKHSLPTAPIETRLVESEEPPPVLDDEVKPVELANPNDRELEVRQVVNAMSVGRQQTETPLAESAPEIVREIDPTRTTNPVYDVPQGVDLDDQIVVKGTTGENLIQLESALDRITWEVAQNLKEKKVLLVWLLDASGSLAPQRAVIEKRLKRVYSELDALEKQGDIPRHDEPLLTGVVSYGQSYQYLTKEPTDKFEVIQEAFASLKNDESGVENVFTAVSSVTKSWSKYRTLHGRRILHVVVTDETGDDFGPPLEQAIAMCRRYGAKTYVLGPSAVFGRRKGFIPYVAPENGKTYDLPVDLGPETAMLENIRLSFWFNGPQYSYLSSGFGPYGLSRLVSETGGVYFLTNMTTTEALTPFGTFDNAMLKAFTPDYRFGSPQEFEADLKKHPLRAAVVMAAMLSEQYQPEGTPDLDIRVTPANFRQVATRAQESAAKSQLALDMILQAFPPGIEKQLEKESSPRWRAAFCLTYGRLLAQKTRTLEYNSALAAMKGNLTPEDVGSKSNHWIIRPDREINYAPSMKRSAIVAEQLLRRILDEAPGTPWALMAARELQDPFGIRVVERFIPPPPPAPPAPPQPPRRTVQLAPEPRNNTPAPRPAPPPPPKLPKL